MLIFRSHFSLRSSTLLFNFNSFARFAPKLLEMFCLHLKNDWCKKEKHFFMTKRSQMPRKCLNFCHLQTVLQRDRFRKKTWHICLQFVAKYQRDLLKDTFARIHLGNFIRSISVLLIAVKHSSNTQKIQSRYIY